MKIRGLAVALIVAVACGLAGMRLGQAQEKKKERFFEMRTYIANEGKLDDLNARFRNHTNRLFVKHGMELVGYWIPADEKKGAKNTLVYILAYADREAREKSWKAFVSDPEWNKARAESEKNGALVAKVEAVYLNPTDYSPIK
jgi:hypothetical protein